MKEDIKTKTTLWLYPATMSRMDGWLHADNCKSRSEFVEKALHFYMGYLATEDVSEYLSKALVATLRGVLADNANRLRSLLFKWCVELDIATHVVAAHFGDAVEDQRELRAFAVDEVKRSNGQISFDKSLDTQRRLRGDEWMD
jgi:hypothetical protein